MFISMPFGGTRSMRRTKAFSGVSLLLMVSLVFLASCSNEQDKAVQPDDPPEASGDADESVVAPEAPAEGTQEEPAASDGSAIPPADATGIADGLLDTLPGTAGDALIPLDVPADPFSAIDEPADDTGPAPGREPDVQFVPTPQAVVDRMLELANVSKDDVVYDLGCGDGRIVVTAAKQFGCKAVGVDIDPERVEESRKNVRENGVEELVEIKQGDIFELDLSPASVITLYLLPGLNVRLIPQLEKLKPGTRIVSHAFDMQGVEPDKVETVKSGSSTPHTVYLWTTPLRKQE